MEFRILGPLEAWDDEGHPIPLGGAKQRALLARLLLQANRVVSSDHLVQALWGEEAPGTARKTLQVHVSQLRKALARDDVLLTRSPGYLIAAGDDQLDLTRFKQLVESARRAREDGRLPEAAAALAEALALWRGPPLSDVTLESVAEPEIRRLEESRSAAIEDRIDLELATGHHDEVIGDARALVTQEPLRERAWGQLMLALYRVGRQADALEAYRQARGALVDELGLEPGPELKALERSILEHDPALAAPARDLAVAPPPRDGASPFVGRERELASLSQALAEALAGEGRVVLVAGEPGIGKSALADRLAAEAGARGAKVLWGRCWEAGGAPAYWPWVQALRSHVRTTDPEALRSQLGAGAADIARILPDLHELFGDLPEPPSLESEAARFRLFDVVVSFLVEAAGARPLVLVLDDVHAADEPSLLLLQFLAGQLRDAPILVVAAYRDVELEPDTPLASVMAELARERVTRRLALAGLSESEVGSLIESSAGVRPPERSVNAIHHGTEGNPLFIGEVVRLLSTEGRLGDVGEATPEGLPIPPGVQEVIGRRLRQLSPECRDRLALASVLGREFDFLTLAHVSGRGQEELLDTLGEALRGNVLTEVPGAPARLRFAHVLIRDGLYGELGGPRRLRLHNEVGEALEALYADDRDPYLAELAHHFVAAGDAGDPAKAVGYACAAGERAVRLSAYEEAARLYGMALDALRGESPAADRTRCELLLALADALGRAGDGPGAKSNFLRAAELARSAGLPELLAQAAVSYGGRFVWHRAASDDQLVPLLEDALSALGEGDSGLRVQLLSRLAAALRGDPSHERRARLCEEAVQAARRLGEPAVIAYALDASESAVNGPDTVERRLADAAELVSLARSIGDRERLFDGYEHVYWAGWEVGDPDRRAAGLASLTRVAEELQQPAQLWMATSGQAVLALAQGRFAEAEQLIERAADIGERALSWSAAASRRSQDFVLRRVQGRFEGLEPEIRRSPHEFPSPLLHRSVLAYVCARSEHTAEASAILDELIGYDLSGWHLDEEWLFSVCLLAETCAIVGDSERAADLYELLLPHARLNAVAIPEATLDSTSRPLGILAGMTGRYEDAARHFEEALRMNARMGARPWVAQTEHDYARVLAARGESGDRERALELAGRALGGYRSLGMDSYAAEAAELQRSLEVAPAR